MTAREDQEAAMHVFVELWNARPEWLALSGQERDEYLRQVGAGMQELAKAGIEAVCWAANDPDTSHRCGYQYLAVWKMPDEKAVKLFEDTVERAGWYRYFEQVNARGPFATPDEILGRIRML
jgi:hypothetical protein